MVVLIVSSCTAAALLYSFRLSYALIHIYSHVHQHVMMAVTEEWINKAGTTRGVLFKVCPYSHRRAAPPFIFAPVLCHGSV